MLRTTLARSGVRERSGGSAYANCGFALVACFYTPLLDRPNKGQKLQRRVLLDWCWGGRFGCLRLPQQHDSHRAGGETQGNQSARPRKLRRL